MNAQTVVVLSIFAIVVGLFISRRVPMPVASIFCAIALYVSGILTFEESFGGFSDSSIVIMVSMFILGDGFAKTRVLNLVSTKIIKPGAKDWQILLGFILIVIFVGSFCNTIATGSVMMPIVYQVCKEQKKSPSRFIQPVCIMCSKWSGLFPFGGAAASYLYFNALIESMGGKGEFTLFTTLQVGLPLVLILTVWMLLFGTRLAADNGLYEKDIDMAAANGIIRKEACLSPTKEKLAVAIFTGSIASIIVCSFTGIGISVPALVGALLMAACGILNLDELTKSLRLPIVFLYVGTLPLCTAISKVGADKAIAKAMSTILLGTDNPYVILAFLFLVPFVLSQFMNNTAVYSIFRPIAIVIGMNAGLSPTLCLLTILQGASTAFCTPMADPVHALGFESGGYTMKQYFFLGILSAGIYFLSFMLIVPLIFNA